MFQIFQKYTFRSIQMAFHPLLLASLSASQHNTPDKIRTGQGRAADIITVYFSSKSPSEKIFLSHWIL